MNPYREAAPASQVISQAKRAVLARRVERIRRTLAERSPSITKRGYERLMVALWKAEREYMWLRVHESSL